MNGIKPITKTTAVHCATCQLSACCMQGHSTSFTARPQWMGQPLVKAVGSENGIRGS